MNQTDRKHLLAQHKNGMAKICFQSKVSNQTCYFYTRIENLRKYPSLYPVSLKYKEVIEGEEIPIYEM